MKILKEQIEEALEHFSDALFCLEQAQSRALQLHNQDDHAILGNLVERLHDLYAEVKDFHIEHWHEQRWDMEEES